MVEVNNTFYRLPEPSTFRAWAAQAPRGFTYALKVSQYGTHRQKLREPDRWLPVFVERARLWAYTRFHGPTARNANSDRDGNSGERYSGDYGPKRLAGPARTLRSWLDQGCDVYAYFNNDLGGAAIRDAAWLSERLTS
jgi:uncharacterized protein YecE (DUF72 family)